MDVKLKILFLYVEQWKKIPTEYGIQASFENNLNAQIKHFFIYRVYFTIYAAEVVTNICTN